MWIKTIFDLLAKWWPIVATTAVLFVWLGITDKLDNLIKSVKGGVGKLFTLRGLIIFAVLGILGFVFYQKIMGMVS